MFRKKLQYHLELTCSDNLGAGYFACLMNVLVFIKKVELLNLKELIELKVDWSQEFFPYKNDPYENGWDLYFEPIVFDKEDNKFHNLVPNTHLFHGQLCINHWMAYDEHLPYRQSMNRILNKYIKIKQPIIDEFEAIYKQHMEGHYCIGVHVRWGSGHISEAPKGVPSIANFISEIDEVMQKTQTSRPFKIFLATDSQEVIQAFENHFTKRQLFYLAAPRSPHREESHLIYTDPGYWISHKEEWHEKKPGYFGGLTVLLDCLLLSKCNMFIHSSSNLSEFVSFYSPHIESIYLPKDDRNWPCLHK